MENIARKSSLRFVPSIRFQAVNRDICFLLIGFISIRLQLVKTSNDLPWMRFFWSELHISEIASTILHTVNSALSMCGSLLQLLLLRLPKHILRRKKHKIHVMLWRNSFVSRGFPAHTSAESLLLFVHKEHTLILRSLCNSFVFQQSPHTPFFEQLFWALHLETWNAAFIAMDRLADFVIYSKDLARCPAFTPHGQLDAMRSMAFLFSECWIVMQIRITEDILAMARPQQVHFENDIIICHFKEWATVAHL